MVTAAKIKAHHSLFDALILEAGFTSFKALLKHHARLVPSFLISNIVWSSIDVAHLIKQETLLVYGDKDPVVPLYMGE
jgi:fermentation-respiration switch protein FrsA (DUF1100 family)